MNKARIDSILQFVGHKKVELREHRIYKQDNHLMLDCSAVAKGYGVDKVAELLEKKGIGDFMVEIGGEVAVKGKNDKGNPWNIGISKPKEGSTEGNEELQAILQISDKALATSGNYRNFYYQGGKKYAHTIDPKSGYPVQHSILSSSVIANDCATADAFATAFMVMGLDKAKAYLNKDKSIEAYFIYADEKGKFQIWHTPGFGKYIAKNK